MINLYIVNNNTFAQKSQGKTHFAKKQAGIGKVGLSSQNAGRTLCSSLFSYFKVNAENELGST
jgi:hypothetical protein